MYKVAIYACRIEVSDALLKQSVLTMELTQHNNKVFEHGVMDPMQKPIKTYKENGVVQNYTRI